MLIYGLGTNSPHITDIHLYMHIHITILYRQYFNTLTCINQLIHINHANKHVPSVLMTDQHIIILIHTIQCLSLTWYAQYTCSHMQFIHI